MGRIIQFFSNLNVSLLTSLKLKKCQLWFTTSHINEKDIFSNKYVVLDANLGVNIMRVAEYQLMQC